MSDNSEQNSAVCNGCVDDTALDMQAAAAIPETAVPAAPAAPAAPARKRKHPKVTNFDRRTKHVLTVAGRDLSMRGTVFSEHADGKTATVSVHWAISELTSSKPVKDLTMNDEVTFYLAPDYPVDAKFRGAHVVKEGKEPMCTLHARWLTANILPAPETTRKGGKRKAESAEVDSEPESKALRAEMPQNVVFAIYLSMDDLLKGEPSLREICDRMKEITGHFAFLMPADMPDGAYIQAVLDPRMGAYLHELFKADPAAASPAMRGFNLLTSDFRPNEPIDLVKVKDFLRSRLFCNGEGFSLVLAYDNASVVNETLPNMAFGDNKRALECAAARAQSPEPSDSESNSGFTDYIDLRDSDSDDE
jgi:hypothetical protein